ncbi:MAG: 3-methyl-2-oxobutanoate hydroxymethyltransferase [Verrucomicrobia bacterium]|nr:MAG: 3-methyl-2-oxobutanoate hydroxymethyltransferase [Verrucomicrobiota bacterium]
MPGRITVQTIRRMKGKQLIVAITAYDANGARHASEAGIDLILVGDSVGNAVLGMPSTVSVTLEMIIHHTSAVVRAQPHSLVVADLPFAEARYSMDHLLDSCRRLLQEARADAVKLEGGIGIADSVANLVLAGIPVLGHIGLLPQRINDLGTYRRFGRNSSERDHLIADARALEKAGAFAIVAEMVEAGTAKAIREAISVPLIGIGSGDDCDGQIRVVTDLLGLGHGKVPSFAKVYADLGKATREALGAYAGDVRSSGPAGTSG